MRALFTCHPALGHFLPLTPIARAVAEAGHEVAFAAPRLPRPAVEGAGFRWLRAGLRDVDAEVLATTGHGLDPAALGPQPGHIHVERFLPLGALLARCSLVVFHGGSGTLIQALARGLPMVILPLGADQPENAARAAELGVARALDQEHLAPEHVREVILHVLRTPSYRRSAERLRDEIERLPGVELAVELLEQLARDKAPILAPR
jgi:MGT family glycosyltransferase